MGLAAMCSPFIEEFESYCVQNIGPTARLQRERVKFEATVKAFNMSASYATTFGSGAKEQIQNWWDQCRVTVADRQPAIHRIDAAVLAGPRHLLYDVKAYAAHGQGALLGILLDCTDKVGQQLLFLKNYGAQMTLDDLILGESTKRQDKALAGMHAASPCGKPYSCQSTLQLTACFASHVAIFQHVAGQFGEGAKVEINRLVQEDCTVNYCTGNAIWTFERFPAPGCTIPELHAKVQPALDLFDFVSISVEAKPSYLGHLLEDESFLFLQGSYAKIASVPCSSRNWSGMELLLDQRHHGKVFIQSVLVTDAPTYKKFGINYTGKYILEALWHIFCLLCTFASNIGGRGQVNMTLQEIRPFSVGWDWAVTAMPLMTGSWSWEFLECLQKSGTRLAQMNSCYVSTSCI